MASRGAWVLGVGMACGLLLGASNRAFSQERSPDTPPAPMTPAQLLPGLHETGRVAGSDVSDPGVSIERRGDFAIPTEARVRVIAAPDGSRPSPKGSSAIDAVTLEREVRTHMASLPICRVEVARTRQVRPGEVTAGDLLLRWTILPNGAVSAVAAIATQPVDPALAACVKQRVNGWTFSPLAGASAEIERILVFAQ